MDQKVLLGGEKKLSAAAAERRRTATLRRHGTTEGANKDARQVRVDDQMSRSIRGAKKQNLTQEK